MNLSLWKSFCLIFYPWLICLFIWFVQGNLNTIIAQTASLPIAPPTLIENNSAAPTNVSTSSINPGNRVNPLYPRETTLSTPPSLSNSPPPNINNTTNNSPIIIPNLIAVPPANSQNYSNSSVTANPQYGPNPNGQNSTNLSSQTISSGTMNGITTSTGATNSGNNLPGTTDPQQIQNKSVPRKEKESKVTNPTSLIENVNWSADRTPLQKQGPGLFPLGSKPNLLNKNKLAQNTQAKQDQEKELDDDRLRILEIENLRLEEQLKILELRMSEMNTKLGSNVVPFVRPDGGPIQEAPLQNLPSQFGRPIPIERDIIQTAEEAQSRARVDLEQGVRILSPDGVYRIEFHDLTQGEFRAFNPSGNPLTNNFDIPRQRLYFTGQVDKYFDFYTVYNRGYGSLDILDAFTNFKFDPAFNIRVGRTKVPYTYEYYKVAEGDLIANERSVFVGNLSPNREIGMMLFGRVLNNRLEYAFGLFNGPVHSFQGFNNAKEPFFFVNTKPFLLSGIDLLTNLNIGASYTYGNQNAPLEPNALRTANDETVVSAVDNVSPVFLRFNTSARELGPKQLWNSDLHWFYRSLTLEMAYNGGVITYGVPSSSVTPKSAVTSSYNGTTYVRNVVPAIGGDIAVTYFITGEEITSRKEVGPLRDFNWRSPFQNPGAIELFERAAVLSLGKSVFDNGLSDQSLYSRTALVFDTGFHWYPSRYIRITTEIQHSEFATPVQVNSNRFTNSMNMFWLRSQLYY